MTTRKAVLSLALAAGVAAPALAQETISLPGRTMRALPVANIHVNIATGERVVTPIGAGTRNSSAPLWLNNISDPCATGGSVGVIDDPDSDGDGFVDFAGTPCDGTIPCEGAWFLWWGDIPYDSVVDCVVLAYATTVPDTDLDSDSIGDGVVGYDLAVTFSDNDNGRGADGPGLSGRSCILDITIPTLAGVVGPLPPGFAAVYLLTLDFASLAPSFIFELGDADGVDDASNGNSGGAIYGHPTGNDIDGDELADFSWSYRFDQSALDPSQRGVSGFLTAGPSDGVAPNATGTEDLFDVYTAGPSCPPDTTTYLGSFDLGGASCEPGMSAPFASCWIELYTSSVCRCSCVDIPAGACSGADLAAPVGVLNFTDVVAFLTAFGNQTCGADLGSPAGVFDFNDVLAFLVAFGAGCP